MLGISTLLAFTLLLPGDTAVVDAATALRMADEASLRLTASQLRLEGAAHEVAAARSWNAPQVEAVVENVGAADPLLGSGLRGAEGQLVLRSRLRIGGARRAEIAYARAQQEASTAEMELVRSDVRAAALEAIILTERDRSHLTHAREERLAIEAFAEALLAGVEAGRFAAGDAARAQGAVVLAITEEARRRSALGRSEARLAYLLGLESGEGIRVRIDGSCPAVSPTLADEAPPTPSLRLAEARLQQADAALSLSRARTIPDLEPQVGIRRSDGVDGLYLGFAFDLPLLGGSLQRTAAARAEQGAAAAEQRAEARVLATERAAVARGLSALESAGAYFVEGWEAALDLSVGAALANYELGDGTLGDLLQARQARFTALRDHGDWLADVRLARVEAARLGQLPLDERLLCTSHP